MFLGRVDCHLQHDPLDGVSARNDRHRVSVEADRSGARRELDQVALSASPGSADSSSALTSSAASSSANVRHIM